MKRIKSIVATLAASLLVFSNAIVVQSSAADSTPKIAVSDAEAEVGGTFTVDVVLSNNPGIIAWRTQIEYDSDVMEITKFTSVGFTKDEAAEKGIAEVMPFSGPITANPFTMSWGDSINGDYVSNGTLATITFKIKDDAEPGVYELEISGDPDEFFNYDLDNVAFTFEAGKINVKEPEVAATGLTIAPTSKDFEKAGDTINIVPTVLPEKATNKKVTYKSSNEKVATVDANGKVTAVKEGSADITVTTEDGGYTAVCKVTVAHEHKMTEIPAKVSTCTEQGNNKYYKCDGCGRYFKDSEGETETTAEAEKLPLAAHSFTNQDTSGKYLKTAATCISKAVYYYSCEACGEKGTETFEYGEPDNSSHVYAEEWKYDEQSHWRECTVGCGTIIDKASHSGGEATCVKKAVCEVCGTEYGEADADNHKGTTEIRGYIAPTVEAEGYTGDTYCLDCGKMIKKGEVIPPHVHQLEKVEAIAATHYTAGNIEYYVCKEDGMKFADAEGTQPLTDEEVVVPIIPHSFGDEWKYDESNHWHECECGEKDSEAGHTFGDWTVVTAAAEDAEGLEERVCTVCGAKETKAIAKLGSDSDTSSNSDTSSDAPSSETGSADNPKTGAATSALAVMGVVALGALVVSKKRK